MILVMVYGPVRLYTRFFNHPGVRSCMVESHTVYLTFIVISLLLSYLDCLFEAYSRFSWRTRVSNGSNPLEWVQVRVGTGTKCLQWVLSHEKPAPWLLGQFPAENHVPACPAC